MGGGLTVLRQGTTGRGGVLKTIVTQAARPRVTGLQQLEAGGKRGMRLQGGQGLLCK
jgi:hypothetical protein